MVESDQTGLCIVLTEYKIKPETGEAVDLKYSQRMEISPTLEEWMI